MTRAALTRTPARALHAAAPRRGTSPLFALPGLSNARETQFLSRASGLPRVEHSPALQLLRAEAGAGQPQPPAPKQPAPAAPAAAAGVRAPSLRPWVQRLRADIDGLERAAMLGRAGDAGSGGGVVLEEEVKTLRAALAEERAGRQRDLEMWAAVKMRMHSLRERTQTFSGVALAMTVLLTGALFYEHAQLWKLRGSVAIAEQEAAAAAAATEAAKLPEAVKAPVLVEATSEAVPAEPAPEQLRPSPVPVPAATDERPRSVWSAFWQH